MHLNVLQPPSQPGMHRELSPVAVWFPRSPAKCLASTPFCCSPKQNSTFLFTIFVFPTQFAAFINNATGCRIFALGQIKLASSNNKAAHFYNQPCLNSTTASTELREGEMEHPREKSPGKNRFYCWKVFHEYIFFYLLLTFGHFPELWSGHFWQFCLISEKFG